MNQVVEQMKVLFIDLDGTLIETVSGSVFPKSIDDWKFKPGMLEAIQQWDPDFVHIVTNQGGIEKGYLKEEHFITKMLNIQVQFIMATNKPITFNYCKSNDPACYYRKPNPWMVEEWFDNGRGGCLRKDCLMVGDASGKPGDFSDSDKQCAARAEVKYMDVEEFIKEYGSV